MHFSCKIFNLVNILSMRKPYPSKDYNILLCVLSIKHILLVFLLLTFCSVSFSQIKPNKPKGQFFYSISQAFSRFGNSIVSLIPQKSQFKDNELYLMTGMNLSKQSIFSANHNSSFIYPLNEVQNNAYKPGFSAGLRIDGKFKEIRPYALSVSINRYAAGSHYRDVKSFQPFLGDFSSFKADSRFLNLNVSYLLKKNVILRDTTKFKLYAVAGPSIDVRLSKQTLQNKVNNNYRLLYFRPTVGVEFDNQSFYTIYLHYTPGIYSINRSEIRNRFNTMEVGMLLKWKDLF